ncbi:hypothetical protein [Bacteroides caecimuris]|uniref:hypothetical protein n=2 Tax=Bacteroides caecimuris TaxID=1796613 RepID=UPI0025746126|nr:hypothetical protein [Bacteroides caecimuris]
MDKILRQIANTIVANLKNTEPIGLFNGKIGIALFLYKYAHYSGSTVYEEIASELINDVFNLVKSDMSPSIIDGMGGIGYGLSMLLGEHLVESDPEENVLDDIDKMLLCDVRSSLMKELQNPYPLYSSGLYLLSRLYYDEATVDQAWITNVIVQVNHVLSDCIKQKKYGMLKLSHLGSMLYVLFELSKMKKVEVETLESLIKDILYLSHQAVLQGDYREIDIVLFGKMLSQLPPIWEMDCYEQLRKSVERLSLTESQNSMDFWYEHLWWSVIYDMVDDIPLNKIEGYIDEKVAEAYFDESIVNNHLAAVGLCLMKNI